MSGFIFVIAHAVPGTKNRLLVCRLAAAVITADGRVTHDERLVYDHALARWRINQSDVTQAILEDRVLR
jgi:urease accessory protein UreH